MACCGGSLYYVRICKVSAAIIMYIYTDTRPSHAKNFYQWRRIIQFSLKKSVFSLSIFCILKTVISILNADETFKSSGNICTVSQISAKHYNWNQTASTLKFLFKGETLDRNFRRCFVSSHTVWNQTRRVPHRNFYVMFGLIHRNFSKKNRFIQNKKNQSTKKREKKVLTGRTSCCFCCRQYNKFAMTFLKEDGDFLL